MSRKPQPTKQLWIWAIPGRARQAYEAADAAGTLQRWQRWARTSVRIVAIATLPIFAAQILAFASFIYEEALQATGFAAKAAIDSRDAGIARATVDQYRHVMQRAQRWQRRWGKLAFWSHPAYHAYFNAAAPAQLASFWARGKALELWDDAADRWQYIDPDDGTPPYLIDTWQVYAIERANQHIADPTWWRARVDALRGFDPALYPPGPYDDPDPGDSTR